MGFILGCLMGFMGAVGLACFGLWRVAMHANKEAASKFLQDCALFLANNKLVPMEVNPVEEGKKKPATTDVQSR